MTILFLDTPSFGKADMIEALKTEIKNAVGAASKKEQVSLLYVQNSGYITKSFAPF